ncbi:MAG: DNA-directed RNA polymerase subunit omega [Deltaproteobacteria bacterium]|nr:DNA-directed RNA polymerase subunit omega [Deltaproteobacteria bacterium]
MARVTVEDCLEREENRFALVMMAAHRSRQLMRNDAKPLLVCKNKPLVTALREIAVGKVRFDRPTADVIDEWVAGQRVRYGQRS